MGSEPRIRQRDLAVALYIDVKSLLDLIARAEGGLSVSEKITTTTSRSTSKNVEATAAVGLPSVLSFLKLQGSLGGTVGTGAATTDERSVDRFETEGSLLLRLRDFLDDESLLVTLKEGSTPAPGAFVELRGVLAPNPLAEALRRTLRVANLAKLAVGLPGSDSTPSQGARGSKGASRPGKQSGHTRTSTARQEDGSIGPVIEMLTGLIRDVEGSDTSLFVLSPDECQSWSAVMRFFPDLARDPSLRELSGVDVRVLAKVVRVEANRDQSISLLDGTGLGQLQTELLGPILQALQGLGEDGLKSLDVAASVPAPVIQVVPIGVYV